MTSLVGLPLHLQLNANGLPVGWGTISRPNPDKLPKHLMSKAERRFVLALMPNPYGSQQPLFNKEGLVELLRKYWGELFEKISDESLIANLTSGEKYCDREYYNEEGRLICSLRLFRKGLLQKLPMPKKGVRFEYWYGYPREEFRLGEKRFKAKYPPHDAFAGWSFRELRKGIGEGMSKASEKMLKILLWDGRGNFICDNCYRLTIGGKVSYLWVEIHTGSEGYDERTFIPRLLTAEKRIKNRGKFVMIVPFKREKERAKRGIRRYNEQEEVKRGEKPELKLKVSRIIAYQEIEGYKEELGYYKHKKRV